MILLQKNISLTCILILMLLGCKSSVISKNHFETISKNNILDKFIIKNKDNKPINEVWTLFDGNIVSEIRQYDLDNNIKAIFNFKDGVQNGKTIFFYKNGAIKEEWDYKNGKPHGNMKSFYKNSGIKEERYYVEGLLNGIFNLYYKYGGIKEEWNFLDGKPHGKISFYNIEGLVVEERNYKDGVPFGQMKTFSDTGKINYEENWYKIDNYSIILTSSYNNGKLTSEKHYCNGKQMNIENGNKALHKDNAGNIKIELYFSNNKLHGIFKKFNSSKISRFNGYLDTIQIFRYGKKHGLKKKFWPNGSVKKIEYFINDKLKSEYWPNS